MVIERACSSSRVSMKRDSPATHQRQKLEATFENVFRNDNLRLEQERAVRACTAFGRWTLQLSRVSTTEKMPHKYEFWSQRTESLWRWKSFAILQTWKTQYRRNSVEIDTWQMQHAAARTRRTLSAHSWCGTCGSKTQKVAYFYNPLHWCTLACMIS